MKANTGPTATYRLQMNQDFRFRDAQALVPYFSRLGVTHAYASPILRAREASTHGYDVVDPTTINPKLGDKTDLVSLVTELRKLGLGLILDIVPNHMAASIENPYWRDVLTYGPSSPFAGWFDIDWRMPDPEMWGRVLVPVLGTSRSRAVEEGQIQLSWSDGRFLVHYFDHLFPVDPATVPMICEAGLDQLRGSLEPDDPALVRINEVLTHLKTLPRLAVRLRRRVDIDREETEQWLAQFAQVVIQSPRIQQWAEETAQGFGEGKDGRKRLRKLLDSQPYRLVYWREAARALNYRRFFDINELISIRQEDPQVFEATHASLLRWCEDGLIDGFRIDHIDGLRDPLGYLERLAAALSGNRSRGSVPVYVEKILAADEKLPCGWPVTGTTGYEFLNQLEGVFVSRSGFAEIQEQYRRLLRRPVRFEHIAEWGKRRILRNDLSPQVGRMADTLERLAQHRQQAASAHEQSAAADGQSAAVDPSGGSLTSSQGGNSASATLALEHEDLSKRDMVDAIVEVMVGLPVYRTYVNGSDSTLSDADRKYVETALQHAHHSGRAAPDAVNFLGEVLLLENKDQLPPQELAQRVHFIQRFQQLSGPAAAKGIEDTALYAYVPLTSLNEVGGEPHLPKDPVAVFHEANEERAAMWPANMLCVTTHDTKRTADVRARLDVLSEVPKLWSGLVRRWRRLNRKHQTRVRGKNIPDPAAECLFYQTVVGLWPAPDPRRPGQLPSSEALRELRERIENYMLKAVREAKTHTSWMRADQEYEDALMSFVRSLLLAGEGDDSPFLSDVQQFVGRIARPGFWNSLARTLVQFTSPGEPDLYQGDELWNFAMVDPDNRRPVDYQRRQQLLDEVVIGIEEPPEPRRAFIRSLVEQPEDDRIKLHVIHSALSTRRDHAHLFAGAQYLPLTIDGPAKEHVLAYARIAAANADATSDGQGAAADEACITVVPRLTTELVDSTRAPLGEVWSDTVIHLPNHLKNRDLTCVLTREPVAAGDGKLEVSQVLRALPVALLISR